MGTVISNLKARFGVDTTDFKKGLKDGEKATEDFKGAAGGILDEFASMFGVNMSGVTDAVGTANKSLSFLGQSFTGAATGGNKLTIGLGLLKFALAATGIGLIVIALGSLTTYFTKSGEGADKFAQILAQVKSVINNVVDRLAVFGKGVWEIMTGKFKQGWETMRGAFKGMGDEIKEDWKASGQLAEAFDKLEDREIALIATLSERKAKASELRQLAKEENEDQKKKLAMINEATSLYKSAYGDEISLERDRLTLMKEELAMRTSDPTDEQLRGIAEQSAKINDLYRQQADQLKGINREKKTALAAVTEELALETAKAAQQAINKVPTGNLKMPALSLAFKAIDTANLIPMGPIMGALEKVKTATEIYNEYWDKIRNDAAEINSAVEKSLESVAANFGEFLGVLMSGDAEVGDFSKMVIGSFADLAITIGKLTIASAITVGVLDKILKNPASWPLALAAGIALVAVGTAVRGSLAEAASGGGSTAGSSGGGTGGGGFTFDTRTINAQPIKVHITGKLTGEGKALVAIIDQEYVRKSIST